ncbi:GspH/FimT family pseudopilin [Maricaulaceae bacterium MS644]
MRPGLASRDAGVSLLEMLAALAIVAVMATAVVIMGDFGDSPEEEAGARLVRSLAEARREALVSGALVGFSADPDGRGYRFMSHGEAAWLVRRDHPALEPVRFSDPDLVLSLLEGGVARRGDAAARDDAPPVVPQVWFDPAGFDDPFAYRLEGADGIAEIRRGDDGAVRYDHELRAPQP